jgi:hypothetical protein
MRTEDFIAILFSKRRRRKRRRQKGPRVFIAKYIFQLWQLAVMLLLPSTCSNNAAGKTR